MSAPLRQLPSLESPDVLERRIRSLLMEGRILDAQDALAAAGPDVPVSPKLRKVLAPTKVRVVDQRDSDRSADFEWLRANGSRYLGQWVALEGGRLLSSAPTLKELRRLLRSFPEVTNPLVHLIN